MKTQYSEVISSLLKHSDMKSVAGISVFDTMEPH